MPSWMDPSSPNYDRGVAEDALFQTIGPLTDTPRWRSEAWYGRNGSEAVPGFQPGGPAPRWTEGALVVAYGGDPALLFKPGARDNPRSPAYGRAGGSPMYRSAMQLARKYKKETDRDFIADLYATGYVELLKLTKPGHDKQNAPFIGWVDKFVKGAMANGTSGSTEQTIAARGEEGTRGGVGLKGIQALQKTTDPAEARSIANQVKGKFQTNRLHDKHDDNPFGKWSSEIYRLGMAYADALESGNGGSIKALQDQMTALDERLKADKETVLGASTGIGQAISTQNRLQGDNTSMRVASIDKPTGIDGGTTMGETLPSPGGDEDEDAPDLEGLQYVLQVALTQDFSRYNNLPFFRQLLDSVGIDPTDNIGGPMTAGEFRYLLRSLGAFATQYPGKGKPRNPQIVREAKGWWTVGTDPELEPLPTGGVWRSAWLRNNQEAMGPTAIAEEMTAEVIELNHLGVEVLPDRLKKANSGKPVLSKAAVGTAIAKGRVKVQMAARIHRLNLGLDESRNRGLVMDEGFKRAWREAGGFLREDLDPIDWRIVNEAFNAVLNRLNRWILEAKSEEINALPRLGTGAPVAPIKWSSKK